MKTKLLLSLLMFATVVPGALAAGDDRATNTRTNSSQSLSIPVTHRLSSGPAAVANDLKQAVQDYDSVMVAITQRFSATLAAIAEAVKRGDLTSDQATEMSGQQYELAQMQFELVSLWREIEQQHSASIPDHELSDSTRENEIVVVALPFSSLQLNQLAEYLNLTESQLKAIDEVMRQEQKNLEPMMTELRIAREKLVTIGREPLSEKEIKSLAAMEANVLAKLIVGSARVQSKIYRVLNPDQQKKLSDFERSQGTVGMGAH